MNKRIIFWTLMVFLVVGVSFGNLNSVSTQTFGDSEPTVCCSQTTSGAFCQDVPATECASGSQQAPTSCDATSFCRAGTCFDDIEGTCLDNTPQLVCNDNGGVWSLNSLPQCGLGCCVLGDQARFGTAQQ